ncbi:VOC family protein [Neptunomonas qingdaonensis]|uniref:PhnB protein n=1 Tax=Neptunomonas qingdaonensis TaxID=1045558 RepID=A0A1I2S7S0_9GAMM|nr:VOC family protein [Neptunomonas qingdaonensis]SFG47759.1 PhnB protein [Neptunomonas qingdaonensis]
MTTSKPIPKGEHGITPYLIIKGADTAIQFYTRVFGAKEIGRLLMPGGVIGHAEMQIGDAKFMLAEENVEWCNTSPVTLGGTPVTIALYVDDVDATYQLALDSGATGTMPVKDEFYGLRVGVFLDPFGHKWHIMSHIEDVSFDEMQKRCDAMFA